MLYHRSQQILLLKGDLASSIGMSSRSPYQQSDSPIRDKLLHYQTFLQKDSLFCFFLKKYAFLSLVFLRWNKQKQVFFSLKMFADIPSFFLLIL